MAEKANILSAKSQFAAKGNVKIEKKNHIYRQRIETQMERSVSRQLKWKRKCNN